MNRLAPITASYAPALIAASGPRASYRFLEFFTANIRNAHTRRAYARAATEFFDWLAGKGVTQLAGIESIHVAARTVSCKRSRGLYLDSQWAQPQSLSLAKTGGTAGEGECQHGARQLEIS
jgi:hypothetical protein